jgi:O-phosphoseryl-tRNA synthetase
MKLNTNGILKRVHEEGFEKVWETSSELLPKKGKEIDFAGQGKPHPVADIAQRLRETFLTMGFDEMVLPTIVEEQEIYKQYGPEASIILDRCYYLATLPRPDIGLSDDKCAAIREFGIPLNDEDVRAIQNILRDYKRGRLDADDMVEKFMETLKISDANATRILHEVFPEFTTLKPVPTNLTLRSHLTSSWFDTLSILQHRRTFPIKLFSVGPRYRREQSEDQTHLRSHFGASCVLLDEDITLGDGKKVAEKLIKTFEFKNLRFEQKPATSKYYAPKTEYEVFVRSENGKWIEVADLGLYSPIALAHYDIEYPVLNLGLGVERLAMLVTKETDVRSLVYPQFYGEWSLSDAELSRMVRMSKVPRTEEGREIWSAMIKTARAEAERSSPCEVTAYNGKILQRRVLVTLYEKDEGTQLLGPAAFNSIYVYKGNVLGIPLKGMEHVEEVRETREKGVPTGIIYLDAITALGASIIESEAAKEMPQGVDLRVRIAKLPSDINVEISQVGSRYITGKQRKVMTKGPVFIGVRAKFE